MSACSDVLAAVRADGALLLWTIEAGENGIQSLLKVDLKTAAMNETALSAASLAAETEKPDFKRTLLSKLFSGSTECNHDVMVGPHGMCPDHGNEDGYCGTWSQRFALLERAGGRILLSAGHPDGSVHSYSIGSGHVSRMQVST